MSADGDVDTQQQVAVGGSRDVSDDDPTRAERRGTDAYDELPGRQRKTGLATVAVDKCGVAYLARGARKSNAREMTEVAQGTHLRVLQGIAADLREFFTSFDE
ncbi:unnamed protein product [Notodromas monacha]|uniref:Uncharacterized protein n=1 Tax=Notodromas monacha TaxID=399045 RepID=A0A7R9BJF5_9CRUS|nr:unnamed protein product [Notodromas monacha]CAG0915260.1 unnamed protein product [Notodromas monacha]